jgi:hypothetical protein
MSRYYDRQGKSIDAGEWGRLSAIPEYKRVASTKGSGRWVSTIWLGLDHGWGGGPPLIFETMVFAVDKGGDVNWGDLDADRYATEEEAKAGHERMSKDHAYVLDKIVREIEKLEKKTTIWSIQSAAAYERLQTKRSLIGDWRRVCKEFKQSYKWMCEQMEDRGIRLNGRPPIWAWADKPDLRTLGRWGKGEKLVRLELEVLQVNLLSSNFAAWHCILNDHYLTSNDDESNKEFPEDGGESGYTRAEIELSWQRVFDLDFCAGQAGYGGPVQVTLPSIELSQVKRVKKFTGR